MGQSYAWRGGNGSLSLAADWADLTTGANPATTVPGSADSVLITGPLAGVLTASGSLSVAGFSVAGGVALTGAVAAGTVSVAGTLALAAGASLVASTATLASGELAASGAGTLFAVSGTLALTGDASAEGGATLTAGAVVLAGGTLEADALSAIAIGAAPALAGTLSVGAGATVSGSGRISGAVALAGDITAAGGELSVFGAVSGSGTLAIGANATLFAAGAVGAGITAAFTGAGGVLELFTTAASFAGSITGFAIGDGIDIASATVTAAVWAGGTLTLSASDGSALALSLPGGNAGTFVALPDGLGGSLVQLAPAAIAAPNAVSVSLGAAGLVLLSGTGHANTLTVTGTVAVEGALTTPQLTQTGTIAVLAGGVFQATSASVAAGLLLGEGERATLTVAGLLTLGGTLETLGGAAASVGTLALAGGTLSLDAASALSVGGAAPLAGSLAVAPGGTLSGHGRIGGALDDGGIVQAQGGELTLAGPAGGTGTLVIAAGATLAAFGAVALPVSFAGAAATLDLFSPAALFAGTLTGFAAGDALDCGADTIDSAVWTAGTLTLLDAGTVVAALSVAGSYAGQAWQAVSDGGGGTLVTLASGGGPLTVTGTLIVAAGITAAGATAQAGALVAMQGGTLNVGTLTLAAGATLSGHGMVAAGVADAGAITAAGGVLDIAGGVAGAGTIAVAGNATLYAPSGIGAGLTVAFTGSGGTLELFGAATAMLALVTGLGAGNAIDIAGAAVTSAVYAATGAASGTLALSGAAGSLGSIALAGAYAGDGVATLPDGRGGTLVSLVPCFVAGTRIATPRGWIAVERLRAGDRVLTPSGPRRLRWVAARTCDAAAAPELRPVRLAAGSLGGALPARDLRLSPQHAVLVANVLVPAVALVNGVSVRREPGTVIQYHHIGFDTHTTVLAEGVAAETYLPLTEWARFDVEHGERPPPGPACAPRLDGGPALEALRRHLFGPPPPPRPPGALLGHLERIARQAGATWLEGWALDSGDAQPVVLPVHRDGAVCGVAVANVWRPDLDRAGLAGGRCGFRLSVAGPPFGVSLRRARDGQKLPSAAAG